MTNLSKADIVVGDLVIIVSRGTRNSFDPAEIGRTGPVLELTPGGGLYVDLGYRSYGRQYDVEVIRPVNAQQVMFEGHRYWREQVDDSTVTLRRVKP